MLLFIDADRDPKTGWLGYDLVTNRTVVIPTRSRECRGRTSGSSPIELPFRAAGNEMEISIPRAVFGNDPLPSAIDFKWADNIQQTGDWSDFTINGDTAPNDRFNYRASFADNARIK